MSVPPLPQTIKFSYATPSLGMHPSHTLPRKLRAIASAGFDGVELGFDDLVAFSEASSPEDWDKIFAGAEKLVPLLKELELEVMLLQPFSNFEGYVGEKHKKGIERAWKWKRVMEIVGCGTMQVGSNDDRASSPSTTKIAADLTELADVISPLRVAYEPWAWGSHISTWSGCQHILQLANRSNLGLCLDTFQTAGREWADPTTSSGKLHNAEAEYKNSLTKLAENVRPKKIYLLQISDALKMDPPLEDRDIDGTPARGRWSHKYRPLPGKDGYLPVKDMIKAVAETGWRGWISVEIFEERHGEEWREGLGEQWAKEAMECVKALVKECGLDTK